MKVSPAQIEYVRSNSSIVDVIGQHVQWDRKKSKPAKGDMFCQCVFHGEKSASMHVVEAKGFYHCFGCAASGDVFKFLQEHLGISFIDAYRQLGGETRKQSPSEKKEWAKKQRQLEAQRADKERLAHEVENTRINDVRQLWHSCVPYENTIANQYLVNRGYGDLGAMPSIRFHGNLYCELDKQRHPCMVAAVQNVNRELTAVWRIFLDRNGRNLVIDGQKVKRGLGPASGGFVRFGPVGQNMNWGEGLESTLGAMMINKRKGSWGCALSTSGMKAVVIPKIVTRQTIWSDGDLYRFHPHTGEIMDPPGQSAAQVLHARGMETGIQSSIMEPPSGSDWDSVWTGQRAVA